MYSFLLSIHNLNRWAVLVFLLASAYHHLDGFLSPSEFNKGTRTLQKITTSLFHIQGLLGLTLLFGYSPYFKLFWSNPNSGFQNEDLVFFGLYHPLIMICALIAAQIGSIKARKRSGAIDAHKTAFYYLLASVILIIVAMPYNRLMFRPL